MGKRTTARRLAMQVLYQLDLGQKDISETIKGTLETDEFHPGTEEFLTQLVEGVIKDKTEMDEIISQFAMGWKIERIAPIDKNIMRLAIYEIKILKAPASVVINEAVNLAKKFSTPEAAKFINGILGKWIEEAL